MSANFSSNLEFVNPYWLCLCWGIAIGSALYAYWGQSQAKGVVWLVGIPIFFSIAALLLPIPTTTQGGIVLGYLTIVQLWLLGSRPQLVVSPPEQATIYRCFADSLFNLESIHITSDRLICVGRFRSDNYSLIQQQLQTRFDHLLPQQYYVAVAQGVFQSPSCHLLPVPRQNSMLLWLSRFLAAVGAVLMMQKNWLYVLCILAILVGREWARARVGGRLQLSPLLTIPGNVAFPILGMGRHTTIPAPDRRFLFWFGLTPAVVGLVLSLLLLVPGYLGAEPRAEAVSFPNWLGGMLGAKLGGLPPWAEAGWHGLLITGLGLLPIGQLEGGHLLHSLVGSAKATLVSRISRVVLLAVSLVHYHILLLPALGAFWVDVDRTPAGNDLDELPEAYDLCAIACLGLGLLILFPG
ncbi:MAG: hypothetical protein RMK91_11730 [Pseudanabaenaceae cyanobacterium SKYGB_i_bin29]|nr:hypothetical protein [Pseudanabaenaceae cyanobacterium SKYG29]MDW8422523.1 hypothetical protein [Pseudanabaenaceae cyanobacterium SKYGB_i_bin29]